MASQNTTILGALLQKAKQQEYACILLSNQFPDAYGKYEILAGFGAKKTHTQLSELRADTLQFGFFSYDLKNQIETLQSRHPAWIEVPDVFFFEPEYFYKKDRNGMVESNYSLDELSQEDGISGIFSPMEIQWQVPSRDGYVKTIDKIRSAIREGTFYELNYCTEWKAEIHEKFDPYAAFFELNTLAPAPFAAFFKFGSKYLLCTSPERFLQMQDDRVVSQPIKGTRRRLADAHLDSLAKTELMTSEKDRAENVMITDLVRNDLSRFCAFGTVEVEELCGIHSFSHVHQMISTVVGKIQAGTSVEDILRSTFPMGSMTGAPKIKVMECTEGYENFKRGWYSGSVGYMEPGRMDWNVVIRSLQFDAVNNRLGYHVGGAITYDSIAEMEFQECMDKAAGILSLFHKP